MINGYLDDIKSWTLKPYKENGNLLDWILFIGLLTVVTVLWTRVITRIID